MLHHIETYRSLFPHLRTGTIWLNHAAIGPLNDRTKTAVERYLTNRSEGTIDDFPQIIQISKRTKEHVGRIINAPPERIGFVNNTSDGLNILTNGIDWKRGDRIILNDSEFPANVVPFLNLKRLGVEIDYVKTRNGEILLSDIESAVSQRTKLLSISFVQFLSGFKSDLTAIGELCKRNNIIFCVDAIQGVGVAPIDVRSSQIDFLSCGSHKWLLSMKGLGFIYITEQLQSQIEQHFFGWTSNKNFFNNFFDYRLDPSDTAQRYETGTLNNAGIIALGESAALLNEIGIQNIHSHLLSLTDIVIEFADTEGISVHTPRDHSKRAGIVSLTVPKAEKILESLNRQNIIVSLREGNIRFSPHFYNNVDDINSACSAIKNSIQ